MTQPDGRPGTMKSLPRGGNGRELSPVVREPDDTDYGHRTFINLLATIFLLLFAIAVVWTIKAIDEQEKLGRCLDTGGRDCVQLVPQRPGVRLPR